MPYVHRCLPHVTFLERRALPMAPLLVTFGLCASVLPSYHFSDCLPSFLPPLYLLWTAMASSSLLPLLQGLQLSIWPHLLLSHWCYLLFFSCSNSKLQQLTIVWFYTHFQKNFHPLSKSALIENLCVAGAAPSTTPAVSTEVGPK